MTATRKPTGQARRSGKQSLLVHGALLLVGAGLAYSGYTKTEPKAQATRLDVQVYAGKLEQLERVELVTPTRSLSLLAKQDAQGRYYVGELTRQPPAPPPTAPAGDAGADAAPATPKPLPPAETQRFVAVSSAEKLAEQLAPLQAYRSLGKLTEAQLPDFGFDKPEGTLKITLAGKTHSLILGGTTPGGADRYVRDADSGVAYAILGSISRDLENADARLTERTLHGFEPEQVTRVRVSAAEQSRELVPVPGNAGAWASAETPAEQDETATNWMTKLGRLRPNKYVGEQAPESGAPVVRVEYFEGKKALGELVLVRGPAAAATSPQPADPATAGDAKFDYYVRTAHTRWYASVIRTSGEQVDQDLSSVLR